MPLLKKVKIGNLVTPNNVWLAPLAGIGDKSYRIVHRRFGAGLTFTEMTSAHGLVYGNSKTSELARLTRRERPAGIQIFGSNPEVMGMAVALLSEYPADVIDINAGCSVPKVLKTGAGARTFRGSGQAEQYGHRLRENGCAVKRRRRARIQNGRLAARVRRLVEFPARNQVRADGSGAQEGAQKPEPRP